MKNLIIISALALCLSGFGQITEKYIGKNFKDLQEQGLVNDVWRQTHLARAGYGVDTVQDVIYKLTFFISNEDIIYWVEGVSTTFEPIQKVYDLVNDWDTRYNTRFTHRIAGGAINLGVWLNPYEDDNYNIYEALNHDDPNKPMQIEFGVTRGSLQSKP